MENIKSFKEIMKSMEDWRNYFAKKIISVVVENLKDAFGYCCRNNLSLNEYLPDNRFGDIKNRNQKTVFISVRLSELWENAIFESIKELFGQIEVDINEVKRWTTPEGDISIFKEIWEIKTSQAKDSWTGATHSSHKVPRYILVHYLINKNIKLSLTNSHLVFPEFSIYLIDNLEDESHLLWKGKPTKNNSFTTFKIKKEWVEKNMVTCIWGELIFGKKTKYATIKHFKNPYI